MLTARDGVRWHLVEHSPGRYDFSSVRGTLRASIRNEVQVIWDLCHYGCPDDLDIFSPQFVDRFARFSQAFARLLVSETDGVPYFTPVNEISFFSWAAGEVGHFGPFEIGRGNELKEQLVRANIAAIEAIRDVHPGSRFVQVDPLIHVATDPLMNFQELKHAEGYNQAVFDGWLMTSGRLHPELGGAEDYLDILGVNYYVHNQWVFDGKFIERSDPRYVPLHELLGRLYREFQRPLFLAETGIEEERRPEWLAYICDEVIAALRSGVPVEGICLYPIVNHPGWADDRHCHNGLWDYCNDCGDREIYRPLADQLSFQRARMGRVLRELECDLSSVGTFV
jgi:beta-glucosidase/6-phospho-beta-glucosidase/beta-galactosidase